MTVSPQKKDSMVYRMLSSLFSGLKLPFLVIQLFVVFSVGASQKSVSKPEPEVIKYGPGVHIVDSILLDKPHSVLEGVARGTTILVSKKGVRVTAPDVVVRNLTIVGADKSVGLHLSNSWSSKIIDVEIERYQTGIKIELNDEARVDAGGKTLNLWPGALTKGKHWGSRVTLTEIRGVQITGPGDGIVLENALKNTTNSNYWKPTDEKLPGEFMTATTILGGHIAVSGRSIIIGDGVYSTKVIGAYLDISEHGGIEMEYGSRGLTLIGVSMDLNSAARKSNAHRLTVPKRASKSIQIYGSTPEKFPINYK